MFRSRKSSTTSPLQPPASTDPPSKSMQSTPGQGQQPQVQVQSPPPPPPLLPPSQYAQGGRGQAQGFPPPQPAYAGDGIGRASSAGTGTGTGAAGAERVKEKRRSGFGWLGGKKKDKEKEEREKINVSIYNRDPFFGIVASDLEESGGGGFERCVLRAMPLSVGIHDLGPVELFILLFYFLLIYIRIRRTVPVHPPFQSTARLPSLRHVPFPPLPPKRSPSPPRPYSPSRNTQPGHSHRTSGRRLRPDSHYAPCRQARSRGPKRTTASDHTAWTLAICSSNRASTGVVSAAGRGKDLRSHRWRSSCRQSTYPVQPPCRCSRPHLVPHPMAAQVPPIGDRRS